MASSLFRHALLFALLALPSAASAAVIFSDDFSANTPSLNPSVPAGWQISNGGHVNILGECNSVVEDDLLSGNNCYVDLDGNTEPTSPTAKNGLLTKSLLLPVGHIYTAYFSLAGNPYNPFPDTVTVTFGTANNSYEIAPFVDFASYSITFTPPTTGTYNLSFINSNIDDHGAYLDNVIVDQVPAPLPLFGSVSAFGFSRRLRNRLRQSRRR